MRRLTITTAALAALISLGAIGTASAETFVPRTAATATATPPHDADGRVDLDHVHQPAARPDTRDQDARRESTHKAPATWPAVDTPRESTPRTAPDRNDDGRRETTDAARVPARVAPHQTPARGKKIVHPKSMHQAKRSIDRDSR